MKIYAAKPKGIGEKLKKKKARSDWGKSVAGSSGIRKVSGWSGRESNRSDSTRVVRLSSAFPANNTGGRSMVFAQVTFNFTLVKIIVGSLSRHQLRSGINAFLFTLGKTFSQQFASLSPGPLMAITISDTILFLPSR